MLDSSGMIRAELRGQMSAGIGHMRQFHQFRGRQHRQIPQKKQETEREETDGADECGPVDPGWNIEAPNAGEMPLLQDRHQDHEPLGPHADEDVAANQPHQQ